MKIPSTVTSPAKKGFFPALDKMPETVTEAFLAWAKDNDKNPSVNNKENRDVMYSMAKMARMAWIF